jgi:hypothetical protein
MILNVENPNLVLQPLLTEKEDSMVLIIAGVFPIKNYKP